MWTRIIVNRARNIVPLEPAVKLVVRKYCLNSKEIFRSIHNFVAPLHLMKRARMSQGTATIDVKSFCDRAEKSVYFFVISRHIYVDFQHYVKSCLLGGLKSGNVLKNVFIFAFISL